MNEIDLRRVDLNLLVMFQVLMAERSVTRAAERLGRTQSAVSHALARLREQLGDPLLVKVGGRLEASPFAERLAEEVRPILRTIERVLVPPRAFDPGASTRVFRLAVPDFATGLFPRLAERFRREAPQAGLEWVVPGPHTPLEVAEGQIDVALGPSAAPLPEGLDRDEAGTLGWATYLRRDHPALAQWSAKAWVRWPHVAVRTGSRALSPVAAALGALERERRVAIWVPSFATVAPLLARTDLIATLPTLAMQDSLRRFDLRALPVPVPIERMPHRLIWSRRSSGDAAIRWIRELLKQAFADVLAAAQPMPAARARRGPRTRG